MLSTRALILPTLSALVALIGSTVALAHGEERTIYSGVYTTEQAERGKAAYGPACAVCHGNTGRGGPDAPGIVGNTLNRKYADTPLVAYFDFIRNNMPLGRPMSLPNQSYVDIVAFLLSAHGAPAGDTELPDDEAALGEILIVPKPD